MATIKKCDYWQTTAVTIVPRTSKSNFEPCYNALLLTLLPCLIADNVTKLKRLFPPKMAYRLIRYKNILYTIIFTIFASTFQKNENFIINGAKKRLGDFPVDPFHF
jgi:hypothetical protein